MKGLNKTASYNHQGSIPTRVSPGITCALQIRDAYGICDMRGAKDTGYPRRRSTLVRIEELPSVNLEGIMDYSKSARQATPVTPQ